MSKRKPKQSFCYAPTEGSGCISYMRFFSRILSREWRRRKIARIIHIPGCVCRFALEICKSIKKRTETLYQSFSPFMVEARGVEPLSEDQTAKTSPSAVCVLTFPPPDSRRRDAGLSSFINSHPSQSLNGLVPCIDDAGYLRRRRLRADGHGLSRDGDGIIIVSSF